MRTFIPAAYAPILTAEVPYPLLFASVSGAHLYGFPSPDSDVDLRGCHVLPVTLVLGLDEPPGTVTRMWQVDAVEVDLVSHDLKKFVTLLQRQHGNFLEQLFAPTVVVDTPWAEELRAITRQGGIGRQVYHAYAGFARTQWQTWRNGTQRGDGQVKTLLYAYRVVLTGIHVLTTGEVNANLADLAPIYGLPQLHDLIATKSAEHAVADLPLDEHDQRMIDLLAKLDEAYQASPLPATPTNRAALNDFVVRVRLAHA
jgi:hypothetical protein